MKALIQPEQITETIQKSKLDTTIHPIQELLEQNPNLNDFPGFWYSDEQNWKEMRAHLMELSCHLLTDQLSTFKDIFENHPFCQKIFKVQAEEFFNVMNSKIEEGLGEEFDEEDVRNFDEFIATLVHICPKLIEFSNSSGSEIIGRMSQYQEAELIETLYQYGFRYRNQKGHIPLFYAGMNTDFLTKLLNIKELNFFQHNQTINAITNPSASRIDLTSQHWLNFLGDEDENPFEQIQTLKQHPSFNKENWRVWDLKTLEHPYFQQHSLLNQDDIGLLHKNHILFLQYVVETYYEERDSISLAIEGASKRNVSLREYLSCAIDPKPMEYLQIRESLSLHKSTTPKNRF